MSNCDRCGEEDSVTTMSIFNTDMCCMACIDIEKKHPKYAEAETIELDAIRDGNYNFPGIGLPPDLIVRKK